MTTTGSALGTELEEQYSGPSAVVPLRGRTEELAGLRRSVLRGDAAATERQHHKGKLTARERIELLLDEDSFHEIEPFRRHRATGFGLENNKPHTDGVITGWGTVSGRTVFVYAHDFRIFGGALGEAHAEKIHKVMDMALAAGAPIVSLNDGAGARIQEGVTALAGYGGIFRRSVACLGCHPADLGDGRSLRGRRGVRAGADRLRVHGPRHRADVHHRPGRHPGRDRRDRHPQRAGRRGRARRADRASRTSSTTTSGPASKTSDT